MLRIGLTGGIGSGKTTVTGLFAAHGVSIIDTDLIAREITTPHSEIVQHIRQLFGNETVSSDGSLDRACLRQIVFSDPVKRRQLEALMHPRIHARVLEQIGQSNGPYCIVVVPLLLEKGWQSLVDRILVVDTPPELQLRRTQQRDSLAAKDVHAIISAQSSREARLAAADDVIQNDADMEKLIRQVDRLHQMYLQLAAAHAG